MKWFIILFIMFFASLKAYSQDLPIPAEGAEWNTADVQGTTWYAKRIIVTGDTIINSYEYSKLYDIWSAVYYQTGVCEFAYSSGPYQILIYSGAIRTDEHQKVYYVPPQEDTSRLIYDFSVGIGDSIQIDGLDFSYYAFIQDIDTIVLGEHQRKRFTLTGIHGLYDEWIEGIGSLYGILATYQRPWERYDSELTCYRESGTRIFPVNTNCDRCDLVTAYQDKYFNSAISIYPNPVKDNLKISWPEVPGASYLFIYDLDGRIIFDKELHGSEIISIARQELKNGILFVEITDNSGHSHNGKIVVF